MLYKKKLNLTIFFRTSFEMAPIWSKFSQLSKNPNMQDLERLVVRQRRPVPEGMRCMEGIGLSEEVRTMARMMGSARCPGTVRGHNSIIAHYHDNCERKGFSKTAVTRDSIISFFWWLEEVKKPYGYITAVRIFC